MSAPCSQPRAEENLGLVHLCANRFRGRGVEYDDLYSAGCIGLMKAVNAFDTERGVRFSTYAVPVILGEIKRLFRDGGTVKVSRSMKELSMRVVRLRDELRMQSGKEPTVQQLAREMGVEEAEIVQALCVSVPPVSLTDPGERTTGYPGTAAGYGNRRRAGAAADHADPFRTGQDAADYAVLPEQDPIPDCTGSGHDPGTGIQAREEAAADHAGGAVAMKRIP